MLNVGDCFMTNVSANSFYFVEEAQGGLTWVHTHHILRVEIKLHSFGNTQSKQAEAARPKMQA